MKLARKGHEIYSFLSRFVKVDFDVGSMRKVVQLSDLNHNDMVKIKYDHTFLVQDEINDLFCKDTRRYATELTPTAERLRTHFHTKLIFSTDKS